MPQSSVARAIKAALSWAWDWLLEHWPTVTAAIIGGGGMTYLATITEWLKPWGAVAFGMIGLLAGLSIYLTFSIAYAAIGKGRERRAQADFVASRAQWMPVNVLAPIHSHEKIELNQFFDHFYHPVENARFEDCVLMGPVMLNFDGGTMSNSHFFDCEIVIVRDDRPIHGAVRFRLCMINRCKIFRVTFLMRIQDYNAMPNEVKIGLVIISDGRVGDI